MNPKLCLNREFKLVQGYSFELKIDCRQRHQSEMNLKMLDLY